MLFLDYFTPFYLYSIKIEASNDSKRCNQIEIKAIKQKYHIHHVMIKILTKAYLGHIRCYNTMGA